MFRRLGLILLLVVSAGAAEAPTPLSRFDKVSVAATKTSIYVGSVTMTMPEFVRKNGVYEAAYTAKVIPYFWLNEDGRLQIEFSDDQLRRLERGEVVEFKGQGLRSDGVARRVEGKASPADATTGKLKVRVFVTKRTELIFNTTYRFEPPPAALAANPKPGAP